MKKVVLLASAIVLGMSLSFAQEPVKKEAKEAAPAQTTCPQARQHKCNHACPHSKQLNEAKPTDKKVAPAEKKCCSEAKQAENKNVKAPAPEQQSSKKNIPNKK